MKIIFLDIDGVLNYDLWYQSERYKEIFQNGTELDIDPLCTERINKICKETNAKIVVSSDWRYEWGECLRRLYNSGLDITNIIGKTSELDKLDLNYPSLRSKEIDEWLKFANNIENYIIIDDIDDFTDEQMLHASCTNPFYGITDEDMNEYIEFLNQ